MLLLLSFCQAFPNNKYLVSFVTSLQNHIRLLFNKYVDEEIKWIEGKREKERGGGGGLGVYCGDFVFD